MNKSAKMQHLRSYCHEQGIKLTPLREDVLALIYQRSQPVGAYELLRELRIQRPNAEPPTVYRVLDFLLQKNLIHRVESLNAYVSCANPEKIHHGQLLLCIDCGDALEISDQSVVQALHQCAESHGFAVVNDMTEIRGKCVSCQSASH